VPKRIWLHIGSYKTGSTSLQHFLELNEDRLNDMGIHYVESGRQNSQHHPLVQQPYFSGSYKTDFRVPEDIVIKERLDAVTREISEVDATHFVISSEAFWSQTCAGISGMYRDWLFDLRSISGGAEINVIAYLRRQDLAVEARYSQEKKTREHTVGEPPPPRDSPFRFLGFSDFTRMYLESGYLDYPLVLARWRAIPEVSRVIVRPYEKSQLANGDTIDDFMSVLGVNDLSDFTRPEGRVATNPGISRQVAIMLEELDNSGINSDLALEISDSHWARDSLAVNPNAPRYMASPEDRCHFNSSFAKENGFVATIYLQRDRDGLFFDQPSAAEDPHYFPPTSTPLASWFDALFATGVNQRPGAPQLDHPDGPIQTDAEHSLHQENDELKQRLAELTRERNEVWYHLDAVTRARDKLRHEFEILRTKETDQKAIIADLRQRSSALEAKIAHLEAERDSLPGKLFQAAKPLRAVAATISRSEPE